MENKSLSLVIPVYNEEESLQALFEELNDVLPKIGRSYEIIFVNDCSSDNSLNLLQSYREQNPDSVIIIDLKERTGQTKAMKKGLDKTTGDIAFTLDADLQNDPNDILKIIEKMEAEDLDCVCGWRKARQDKFLKAILSKFGNILQRLFTGLKIHDVSCTLRGYKKHCVDKIPLNWEGQHRFIPLCLSLQGYKVGEIISNHRQRSFGISKYGHKRIFRVIFDFFKILKTKGRK